jgi:hypothetical protein
MNIVGNTFLIKNQSSGINDCSRTGSHAASGRAVESFVRKTAHAIVAAKIPCWIDTFKRT